MINYVVCYPAGSSGRFLSTVIYKIANGVNETIITTDENSAHLEQENKIITGYKLVKNNNHPFVYKEMIREVLTDVATVFSTHAFPKFKIIRSSSAFDETKFIQITYDEDDYKELVANVVIKSLIPQIKTVLESENGLEDYKHKIYFLGSTHIFLTFKNIYGYEITLDNLMDVSTIKNLFEIEYIRRTSHEPDHYKFKYPIIIPDDFRNKTLILRYKDIFTKTKTSYVALEELSDFIGVPIPINIMNSYANYVNSQPIILNKYVPWLTNLVDN
jgi:hypothetical protein